MKRFFVSALAVCAMCMMSVSMAQEPAKKECPTQEGRECVAPCRDMAKELNLTPEQQAKMKEAHEEFTKACQESREEMKAAGEKHREAIDEILTPEQKAKMKEMRMEKRANKEMRHHRVPRGHKHAACDSARHHKPCRPMEGEFMKGDMPCPPPMEGEFMKGDMPCPPPMEGEFKKGDKPCPPPMRGECKKSDKPCTEMKGVCKKGA